MVRLRMTREAMRASFCKSFGEHQPGTPSVGFVTVVPSLMESPEKGVTSSLLGGVYPVAAALQSTNS